MLKIKVFCFFSVFIFSLSFALKAQSIFTFAGDGTIGSSGNGVPATTAKLYDPQGVCADNAGNIYIADAENHIVRKVSAAGIITTIAGNGTNGYSGDGGLAINAQLKNPRGICIDNDGNIYVSDEAASVVRKISSAGIISTFAGNGTINYGGDGGPATQAGIFAPTDICIDTAGNLYIVDFAGSVRKVNSNGIIATIAGNNFSTGSFGDGGPATQAQLNSPVSICIDYNGNIYISEIGSGRIRKINSAGIISTFAGGGLGYVDGGPANNTYLNGPFGVVADALGNIYIGEAGTGVVRKVDVNGIITTIAGNGTHGYSGDGGPATVSQLSTPGDLCLDNAGNMYVTDAGNFVVRKVENVLSCAPELFLKTYASGLSVKMKDATLTTNEDQIIGGDLFDPNTGTQHAVLLKIDNKGEKIWENNYLEKGQQTIQKIITLKDGNYLAAGININGNNTSCFLLKLDANGNTIWRRDHQFNGIAVALLIFTGLKEDQDGSILLGGNFDEGGSPRIFYMKFDLNGALVFSKSFQPPSWAILMGSMGMVIKDGYSYITGLNRGLNFFNGLLLKVNNANGNIEWSKQYESINTEFKLNNIFLYGDQLGLVGSSSNASRDSTAVLLVDTSGAILQAKQYYYPGYSAALKVLLKKDNNIVLMPPNENVVNPASAQTFLVSEINFQTGIISAEKYTTGFNFPHVINAMQSAAGNIFISGNNIAPDPQYLTLFSVKATSAVRLACPPQPINGTISNTIINPGSILFTAVNISMQEIASAVTTAAPVINVINTICNEIITCSRLDIKAPASICSTDTLNLEVDKDCSTVPIYQYDTTKLQLFSSTDTLLKFKVLNAGSVSIKATINNGCTLLEDSLQVAIGPAATKVQLGSDTSICEGNSVLLNAHAGYANYLWQDGSSDSILLISSPGTYHVTVTGGCGTGSSDTINVTRKVVTINIGSDRKKCNSDTVQLAAPAGYLSYSWSNNYFISSLTGQSVVVSPLTDTAYFIKAEKSPGCFAFDTVKIFVNLSNPINLGSDKNFCSGDSTVFDAGGGFSQYLWINGTTAQKITVVAVGDYSVIATALNGCRSYDTVKVLSVFPLPLVNLNSSPVLCKGESRNLDAGTFSSYLWNDGSTGKTITVNSLGTYWVRVTDINGCKASDSIAISNIASLPAHFLDSDTAICSYESLVLQSSNTYLQYFWSNNSTASAISISQPGLYWLRVTDNNNCSGLDSILVSLKDCTTGFFIPSAFTPNNDSKNDLFKPLLLGNVKRYSFCIANRFGEIIFQTTELKKGWDGKYRNKDQNPNAYVWICTYQFEGQNEITKKGTVVLIR